MAAPRDWLGAVEEEGNSGLQGSSGVEVVFPSDPATPAPLCPHGPTLLFMKSCQKLDLLPEKLITEDVSRLYPERSVQKVYLKFIELPLAERRFCQRCQQLLLPDDWEKHREHWVVGNISASQLGRPTQLLRPLENKKTNAQYLFAERTCHFLVDLLPALGLTRVLCVGTPRLHELIRLKASGDEKSNIKSLLLDIDFRYSQFYMEDSFCRYNMFNHHFFDGKAALEVCRTFLQEDKGEGVIMVTDPPFGGLVEPLAVTFKKLIAMWKEGQSQDSSHKELPVFWIFPYFFESRIRQFFPSFCMLDYQIASFHRTFICVDYDNHALYKHGKTGRKQSPVRIFTNIPPSKIILPSEEGYSTDGRKWNHCFLCKKCVKPSWIHCSLCGHCALPDHSCGAPKDGCFICGELDHKRSTCPQITASKKVIRFCCQKAEAKKK
ncbi:rRNA N6-adenosine-methyltransferase ZCCHC4 isoform X2 [Prionailurus iriomotensis]